MGGKHLKVFKYKLYPFLYFSTTFSPWGSILITLPDSFLTGNTNVTWGVTGEGGSGTLNSVGIALGLSFLPPAGDLAISSNWLSSKWSCKSWKLSFMTKVHIYDYTKRTPEEWRRSYLLQNWILACFSLAWHSLEQGVGTKSRRQFTSHFLVRTGSFGKRKSCFPIVVEFEQFGAEHPPIFIYIRQMFNLSSGHNNGDT